VIRTCVAFRHPALFVPLSAEDGILSIRGAHWFVPLLKVVPDLEIKPTLCQEDRGVVVFAERKKKTFRIGLGAWTD
jgi:hypothetical protein